jgi:2-polyprenyl-3-methyl-5-hydroxy-6-metoxy-1,4-benzoquinol methylase
VSDATARLYDDKESGYFSTARPDLLRMLPQGGALRLLELGAGDGATLRAAKELGLASWVAGIDIVAPPAAAEGQPEIDLFLHGNIEALDPALLPGNLDAILCADVLEHLVEPWRVVSLLAGLLNPGGILLSSIPNVRNHRALREIVLRGDFRYQPAGLLDRSHLRFFCRRNVRELFEQAGLAVEAMEENMGGYGLRHRLLDRLTLGRFHDFFVFQFRTLARKP